MSGRSAAVRKAKTKYKEPTPQEEAKKPVDLPPSYDDFPVPGSSQTTFGGNRPGLTTSQSITSSGSDERSLTIRQAKPGYARPQVPEVDLALIGTAIEKSAFRSMMDQKSEGIRKGLIKTFGKKKKEEGETRSEMPTLSREQNSYELDTNSFPLPAQHTANLQDIPESRAGPPRKTVPQAPSNIKMYRWAGGGKPAMPWSGPHRKDDDLYDLHSDAEIYLFADLQRAIGSPPVQTIRLPSQVLQRTPCHVFNKKLEEGRLHDEDYGDSQHYPMPLTPLSSPGTYKSYPVRRGNQKSLPPSEYGADSGYGNEVQVRFKIYFHIPQSVDRSDLVAVYRHAITTRNVFALLSDSPSSLVGRNLFEALNDLQTRLEEWLPPRTDCCAMIINFLQGMRMDDVREDPALACSLLAWSAQNSVTSADIWVETFVHCCGMFNRLETAAPNEYKLISHQVRANLERNSYEMLERIESAENCISKFEVTLPNGDKLASYINHLPSRQSYESLRKFFCRYYQTKWSVWPPAAPAGEESWLTREIVKGLQSDFGALYDYLVDRSTYWDENEARSSRKLNIGSYKTRNFDPDTTDFPITDVLAQFDKANEYARIPRPYPLVPKSVPTERSKENIFKANKKQGRPEDEQRMRRKLALAYSDSSNLQRFDDDYGSNHMIEEFDKFEKKDLVGEVDPFDARRGRWVLIYAILQTLATVSVDVPFLRYKDNISYHISTKLKDAPSFVQQTSLDLEGATDHNQSYCFVADKALAQGIAMGKIRNGTATPAPILPAQSIRSSTVSGTDTSTDYDGSVSLSPAYPRILNYSQPVLRSSGRSANRSIRSTSDRSAAPSIKVASPEKLFMDGYWVKADSSEAYSHTGYAPGIEKVEDGDSTMRNANQQWSSSPRMLELSNRHEGAFYDYDTGIKTPTD